MIRTTIENGVATLMLDNPARKNALSAVALADAVEALRRDATVRALILTGAGSDFCSGGDVSAMQGPADTAAVRRRTIERRSRGANPCSVRSSARHPCAACRFLL
ncbi:MAG TPA: enoyl-CoA hydratase-related protein [Paraburkholderia sp.]|uniref:enoyl-CoA hydratase/isomerase family protein n=1 Tax=Paraburkholderia sp. TaxID=1926495 RepID=UPI002B4719FE|nr:enoyl-CoA hydratase-related protein [Paraburkholderia sp.]HKR39775.1 enoyl-CoA hydratase-related protein [Paraburkholderia sp.]